MRFDPNRVVAHRGWPSKYPENSLDGFSAAIAAGARNIEFDVQLSRDSVPVVLHDETTARVGGNDRLVFDLPVSDLTGLSNGEPLRFGQRFASSRIPTLSKTIEQLDGFDGRVFIELKRESIKRFGAKHCLAAIAPVASGLGVRAVLISFDAAAVSAARDAGFERTGWVIRRWNKKTEREAAGLEANYLFISRRRLDGILPDKPWRWVVYDVDRIADALGLYELGIDLVETDFIGEFLGADRDGE